MRIALFALAASKIVACAATAPPARNADLAPASTAEAVTTASASPSVTPSAPAPAQPSRPLDLSNVCPRDIRLYYGEAPGDGHGQFANVAAGGTVDVPRGTDGSVVVWVVDARGLGLASVHVTRRMTHIHIDPVCMHIDAR